MKANKIFKSGKKNIKSSRYDDVINVGVGLNINMHMFDETCESEGIDYSDVEFQKAYDNLEYAFEKYFNKKFDDVPIVQSHDDYGYWMEYWVRKDDEDDINYMKGFLSNVPSFESDVDDDTIHIYSYLSDFNDITGIQDDLTHILAECSTVEIVTDLTLVDDGVYNSTRKRGIKMRKPLRNNRKPILSAENGGWEVKTDEVWEAYDMACEYMGKEAIDDAIIRAMGNEELAECLAYVFRMYDFREWKERFDDEDLSNSHKSRGWAIVTKRKSKIRT